MPDHACAGLPAQPSAWVGRFAPLIPPGEVLDLACGGGRHSLLLNSLGYQVCAVDRDTAALDALGVPGIATLQFDLEDGSPWPFAPARFAAVVVTNYLHRPLFPAILASVAPGGVLIYETFACGNERFGKPSSPGFLLKPAELLDIVRDPMHGQWRVVAFEDGFAKVPKPAMVQRICAISMNGKSSASNTADYPAIF